MIFFPKIEGGVLGRKRDLFHEKYSSSFQVKQVHGDQIIRIEKSSVLEEICKIQADAIITACPKTLIAVRVADCVPILLAHPSGVVAAVHAGWRGTEKKIVQKTALKMKEDYCLELSDLKVWIGPAICENCYEVGEEVASHFFSYPKALFRKSFDKFLLNLKEINRLQLIEIGLSSEQVHVSADCTFCQSDQYYSHRAFQKGKSLEEGRNLVWIRSEV